jgi:hypothetical protein
MPPTHSATQHKKPVARFPYLAILEISYDL